MGSRLHEASVGRKESTNLSHKFLLSGIPVAERDGHRSMLALHFAMLSVDCPIVAPWIL